MIKGASFSECRKYRYYLYRIWDDTKPLVMFIGLNPSTANEKENDATISRVIAIATNLGYGGVYMCNCFAYISTKPKDLVTEHKQNHINLKVVFNIAELCKDIIFAWGNFKVAHGTGKYLSGCFPNAKALIINKNGSPRHPLYVPTKTQPVKFYNEEN